MRVPMIRGLSLMLVGLLWLGGCAAPHGANGRLAVETVGRGMQDKVVATLMALGAESVKSGKRSPEYWRSSGDGSPAGAPRSSGSQPPG